MPPIMQSELQQAMMTSFLLANANNYRGLLHGEPVAAAPWQVRRAEQFIEANWDQPITIEALASATNVSARGLFSSFKAGRGYSPMDFVKRVRLGRAGRNCRGFGNPGHFARDYHHHFGERPSETLRRGRGALVNSRARPTSGERPLRNDRSTRFDPIATPSGNDRYLRAP